MDLLAISQLNSIEVLISKALIDSVISHHQFVSISNVQREYDDMKEAIKNLNTYLCESLSKILVYLRNNVMILFELSKKYKK